MSIEISATRLRGYRFPRSVILWAVWAYHRFALSLRDVEDLLAERGVLVSHETIRVWNMRFGPQMAARIRRDRPSCADKWHMDEMAVRIDDETHWLWRAIDANGDVVDILIQQRRDAKAARKLMKKLLKRWGAPRVLITDKLRSYSAAIRSLHLGRVDHRSHKGLNNRMESSHRHTRRREKIMGRFKSPGQAQRFLSAHDQIAALFQSKRHRLSARSYRHARADAFDIWRSMANSITA